MKLVILIRGYLYKFYKPASSYKKFKNFKYLINFTKLIERYELLTNKLSQKYAESMVDLKSSNDGF